MAQANLNAQRLHDLEGLIQLDYEKLQAFEQELTITANIGTKFEVQHRIRNEILPSLRRHEREYAEYLATTTAVDRIPEAEAHDVIDQVLRAANSLSGKVPDEAEAHRIADLKEKLSRSGTASAKLKLSLPIIPMIASYEVTLDTEGLMMSAWRGIKAMFAKLAANPT